MTTSRTGARFHGSRRPLTRLRAVVAAGIAALAVTAVPALPARAASAHHATAAAERGSPASHLLSTGQARALARKTGKPVQVTGATTASSTLTANPSGSLTLTEQSMPVRRNVHGQWKALDATLHRDPDGTVSPAVTTDPLRLSGGGTGPLVSTTYQGHTLSLAVSQKLPAPVLSGATATYANVPAPGTDLEITADDQGGFEETLIVRNAAAARSPALRSFSLRPTVTGGLGLHADAHGNLTASRGGHAFFEIPAATMWDSRPAAASTRTAADPAYGGRKVDLRDGQPVTSAASGPGENARTASLRPRLTGGTITYTPAQSVLAGKDTVYPVYIDPAAGSTRTYWAQVDNAWPSQTYPKPNPMQVGYNGWQTTLFTARSFVNESVPTVLHGSSTDIESARLYLWDEYAPTCSTSAGDEGVQVWRTGGVTTSTDWANQPAWAAEQQEKSFAHGYSSSSCPGASEGFDVTEAITTAAHSSWSQVTFGIRADSESDPYGWKQFDPALITLSTTFDRAPNAPSDLRTSPVTSCTAATPTTVGLGDVTLYATVSDPLGSLAGSLTATVTVTDTTTGQRFTESAADGSGSPFTLSKLGSGSLVTVRLPESDLKTMAGGSINEFAWSATVTDGTLTSPASATCHFNFDPTTPGQPTVCPDGASCDPAAPQPSYTIGTAAKFDVTPNAAGTTPASYTYQLNGGAPQSAAANSGDAAITVTPTRGFNVLSVIAVSAGGNIGQPNNYLFTATAPANAADGDMSGDGVPDLLTPGGGSTGLPPGLWLARGEEAGGSAVGDGQVLTSIADIGTEGDGIAGDHSPSDFDGAQVITGLFNDNGFQDTLAYFPPGSGTYAGQGAVLGGTGDGTAIEDQGAYTPDPSTGDSALTAGVTSDTFTAGEPNEDSPLQIANAYAADPSNLSGLPDLIGVNGDATHGYYLDYYQNCSEPGCWMYSTSLSTPTPDNDMHWDQWKITTMAEPSGTVDMFLSNTSSRELYLWQDLTVDVFWGTASYHQFKLSSDWNPGALSELRAADITGTGPALWSVTTGGSASAWIVSGLTTAPAVTPQPAQSLLAAAHSWRLGDGTSGTATTAADQPGPGSTEDDLAGTAGVTWNTGEDLFSPDAVFTGSSSYMNAAGPAVTTNKSFTVSAWVDPSALGGTVFSQNGDLYAGFAVSSTTGGHWQVEMNHPDTSTSGYTTVTGGTARAGMWTNLTLTYSTAGGADILNLYVNGTESISITDTSPPNAAGRFSLGSVQSNGKAGGFLTGQIADVKAWNSLAVPAQPSTPGSVFVPLTPVRIMDTRSSSKIGSVTGPVAAGATATLAIDGNTTAGLPATGITAAAVAVSALTPTGDGHITVYPDGASQPDTSTVSFTTGTPVTNNTIVPVGPDGKIALTNASPGTVQIAVDLTGYFTTDTAAAGASTYTPLTAPARILDTRNGTGAPKAQIAGGGTLTLPIAGNTTGGAGIPATGVTAVALTLTAIIPAPADTGWIGIYPDGGTLPTAAELTYDGSNQSGTSIAVVPVSGDGKIDIHNASSTPVDLTGDVAGYFTSGTGGEHYHPLDDTRLLDTRQTTAVAAYGNITIPVPASIPADNPVLVLTIAALNAQVNGYLTAYPSTASANGTAAVNFITGQTASNLELVNTATGNALAIGNASSQPIQVVADTNGYFS